MLFDLIKEGKTQFHVVRYCIDKLTENGYQKLDFSSIKAIANKELKLEPGKYYIAPFSSSLFAFDTTRATDKSRFKMAACHTDFPMLKLKSNPEISKSGYLQVNVEGYGGLIKTSWFDRPLGLAGKVVTKGEDAFSPSVKLFDSKRPIFIIPNLAPHLDKDSKNREIDVQKEMLPIALLADDIKCDCSAKDNNRSDEKHFIANYVARELNINEEEILDYDLYLYICEEPRYVGLYNNMIAGPRIDNISSVSAILEAMINCSGSDVCLGAFFDNEEIGSRSKQGADNLILRDIYDALSTLYPSISGNAFCISADVAHATHPNYGEKSDITNTVVLGQGVVLKSSASQRYVSDSEASSVIIALSEEKGIRLQRALNRSGMPGGQTLGPIMSSYLPMLAVDMGVPMLAMHSACELIAFSDYEELRKLLIEFYKY